MLQQSVDNIVESDWPWGLDIEIAVHVRHGRVRCMAGRFYDRATVGAYHGVGSNHSEIHRDAWLIRIPLQPGAKNSVRGAQSSLQRREVGSGSALSIHGKLCKSNSAIPAGPVLSSRLYRRQLRVCLSLSSTPRYLNLDWCRHVIIKMKFQRS